jgi:hypothetical protein
MRSSFCNFLDILAAVQMVGSSIGDKRVNRISASGQWKESVGAHGCLGMKYHVDDAGHNGI